MFLQNDKQKLAMLFCGKCRHKNTLQMLYELSKFTKGNEILISNEIIGSAGGTILFKRAYKNLMISLASDDIIFP